MCSRFRHPVATVVAAAAAAAQSPHELQSTEFFNSGRLAHRSNIMSCSLCRSFALTISVSMYRDLPRTFSAVAADFCGRTRGGGGRLRRAN